jgi:hypothetical protein
VKLGDRASFFATVAAVQASSLEIEGMLMLPMGVGATILLTAEEGKTGQVIAKLLLEIAGRCCPELLSEL